jgi:hypothetical protein
MPKTVQRYLGSSCSQIQHIKRKSAWRGKFLPVNATTVRKFSLV